MANKKNYKTLSGELDDVLLRMQSEDVDIDEALELYKRGQGLIAELEKYLSTAKNEIQKIKQ